MNEMNRFRLSELTGERILNGILRRFTQVQSNTTWKYSSKAIENRQRLQAFENQFVGERCFILANGPSLAKMDLTPLRNEITFGMNRIYLLFDQLNFKPTFYVAVNDLVVKQYCQEIFELPIPKFLNWDFHALFPNTKETLFVKTILSFRDKFSKTILQPISSGGTVTFVTLQIAFFMGFREVILIGLDHSFNSKGVPNTTRVRETSEDRDHFHPNYFPMGTKWQLPDLRRSEFAYAIAKQAFEEEGRNIFDATTDGKCLVFKKVNYSSLFK